MVAMNDNAARILAEPVTGTLSIAGSDGYAHSTPVWFVWRDGKIWVSTHAERQKHVDALRSGKGSLSVIDPTNSFHYVELRGPLHVVGDPNMELRDEVVRKHGHVDGKAFDPANTVRIGIVLTPVRVLGRH